MPWFLIPSLYERQCETYYFSNYHCYNCYFIICYIFIHSYCKTGSKSAQNDICTILMHLTKLSLPCSYIPIYIYYGGEIWWPCIILKLFSFKFHLYEIKVVVSLIRFPFKLDPTGSSLIYCLVGEPINLLMMKYWWLRRWGNASCLLTGLHHLSCLLNIHLKHTHVSNLCNNIPVIIAELPEFAMKCSNLFFNKPLCQAVQVIEVAKEKSLNYKWHKITISSSKFQYSYKS